MLSGRRQSTDYSAHEQTRKRNHFTSLSLSCTLMFFGTILQCGCFPVCSWTTDTFIHCVSMASLTEVSFNWLGFTSAMISNISFTFKSIYSKKAMLIWPKARTQAAHTARDRSLTVRLQPVTPTRESYHSTILVVGIFYHLSNQIATNTLERSSPLTWLETCVCHRLLYHNL